MPSVNMIAPRRAEVRRLERDMRRLVVLIVVELTFAVGLGGWLCTRLISANNRIAQLDAQIARLRPVVNQIESYDRAADRLAPKLKLLNQAKDCTMRWYNALDRLTQSLPQSTYLTRLTTTSGSSPQVGATVNLNGVSISQTKIGETIMRLQRIPEFERVDLRFTQKTSAGRATALEFEIGAEIKDSELQKGAQPDGSGQS